MSTKEVKIIVDLPDETKALLKSAVASAKTIGAAAGKPAAGKSAKSAPVDDDADDDMFGDGDGEDGEDGDGDDGDGDDGDGDDGDDGDEVNIDNVGEALKAYATAPGGSKALAMKLLKAKGGADKLSALKDTKFAAVIEAAITATAALKKKAKAAK